MKPRRRRRTRAVSRTHAFRCALLSFATVAVGGLIAARAFQLQLVQGDQWRDRAITQTTELRELPATRGGIYDRHGRPLAISRDSYAAFYAPAEVIDERAAVAAIDRVLDLGRRKVERLLRGRTGWLPLGHVDGRTRVRLEQAVQQGIYFDAVPARSYPEGHLASSLLGSLDSEGHGQSGLELVLDSLLTGTPGEQISRRDAHGKTFPLRHAGGVEPQPGRDVYLTIDAELQEIAEAALGRALAETGASGGDVILADPRTGEILALASYADGAQARIPAFTDPYEPGSTAKPFLLATLLQEDLAELGDEIDVEGGTYETPYRTITDVHGYDTLTVAEIILYSSNVGAAKLAERIENPGLQYAYLRDFGFGTPTGVETASESSGVLRRPARWSALSQQSLAFGYEMTVTSIQLVAAYGALANDGVLMRPTLIRGVSNAAGEMLSRHEAEPVRRLVDRDVADQITRVLARVVSSGTGDEAALRTIDIAGKTGTSRISEDGGYGSGRYVASFVGYLPADDPQLVVLAKLTDPQSTIYGGGAAAPVSRTVVQAILAAAESGLVTGRVAPPSLLPYDWDAGSGSGGGEAGGRHTPFRLAAAGTRSSLPASADPPVRTGRAVRTGPVGRIAASGDVVLPDLRGLGVRAAAARLHALGLHVENLASGRITATEPPPGTRVVPGARVLLR